MASRVRVEGLDEAISTLGRFQGTKGTVAFIDGVAPRIERGLADWAPYRDYTGRGGEPAGHRHLRDSIHRARTTASGRVTVRFWSDVPQARWVIDGTRPHRIVPKRRTFLSWMTDEGRVFAKAVNHPGTRANPFPRHYWQLNHQGLQSEFVRAVQRAFADAGRGR